MRAGMCVPVVFVAVRLRTYYQAFTTGRCATFQNRLDCPPLLGQEQSAVLALQLLPIADEQVRQFHGYGLFLMRRQVT